MRVLFATRNVPHQLSDRAQRRIDVMRAAGHDVKVIGVGDPFLGHRFDSVSFDELDFVTDTDWLQHMLTKIVPPSA